MHGNYAPNALTNQADVILAIGMRFDDRVTGRIKDYAKRAKIIHIDVDASEHHKNVKAHIAFAADAKDVLIALTSYIKKCSHPKWLQQFQELKKKEKQAAYRRKKKANGQIRMDEAVTLLSKVTNGNAIVVADVGQNQMFSARFYEYKFPNSYITSGGLGTMGFALPAAIGAKLGAKNKEIYAIIGDGGFQMTIQELGTIAQEKLPIKIMVLNNHFLGMVRQWQQLFFDRRYSFTTMYNPDFIKIAEGYGIPAKKVTKREELEREMKKMREHKGAYLLDIEVEKEDNIFPMVPTGASVEEVQLEEK